MAKAAALLLAALALSLVPAATSHARVPASFFGVMADGPLLGPQADLGAEARLMRRAGVGSMRVAFYWRDLQPQPGPVAWAQTDRIVEAAARARVRVLPILVRAPGWAAGGDEREGAVPAADQYGAWVGEVVRRYGPSGSFWAENPGVPKTPVRQWQVWNEPDITRYLTPPAGRSWPRA